eukprot:scaffold85010_cov36-Phaeocystis_antarctica.AAC.3
MAWPKRPGSQQPVRPPTTLESRPLAQGHPLGPRGAPSPFGCRRGPAAAPPCACPQRRRRHTASGHPDGPCQLHDQRAAAQDRRAHAADAGDAAELLQAAQRRAPCHVPAPSVLVRGTAASRAR